MTGNENLIGEIEVRRIRADALRDYAASRYEAYLLNPELDWTEQPGEMSRFYKRAAEDLRRHADRIEKGDPTDAAVPSDRRD